MTDTAISTANTTIKTLIPLLRHHPLLLHRNSTPAAADNRRSFDKEDGVEEPECSGCRNRLRARNPFIVLLSLGGALWFSLEEEISRRRDLIADCIVTFVAAQWYEGNISIPEYDKNMQGTIMSMGWINQANIMVCGETTKVKLGDKIEKIGKDLEAIAKIEEVEQAECECCGLKEECTPDYIAKIKDSHSSKWVCGLCSEAVKERLIRHPKTAIDEALSTHRNLCQEFCRTRLNPKLSLTSAMRNIARKSWEKRNSNNSSPESKIGRSYSCFPDIDLHTS
ncbi:hypothetical protein U1Q18_043559 [Sarracenia purpurea var. burkii]